jgi:hypothetical protein
MESLGHLAEVRAGEEEVEAAAVAGQLPKGGGERAVTLVHP